MTLLISSIVDSKKLDRAWSLDQRALFHPNPKQKKKLWATSIGLCRTLLEKYTSPSSDRYQILSKLALIYQHQSDFNNAKRSLDMIKKDNPRDPIMMFNFGNLYRAMNQPKRAIEWYKNAIRAAKNFSQGRELFLSSLYQYKAILAIKKPRKS